MNTQRKEPNSYAEIAFGCGLMGLGYWLWPEGSAYAQQWIASGLCGFLGGVTVLKGTQTFQRELKVKRDRAAAALPSGTYGNARFASLDDLQAAGLTHPAGLFLGAQEGVLLFYDGKAHLLTVAPARQGKGISVVIPNLLHFQGSVFVTDPKGELCSRYGRTPRPDLRPESHCAEPVGSARPSAASLQPAPGSGRCCRR
jgi:type IV secretory pathway TraG/TraD family ATPase VirD4